MFQLIRVLCLSLCVLSFSGCGRKDRDETVIRFWHIMNYSGPREVLAEAVSRFEAKHPGVRVEVESFSNDDYKTKLALEMASGNEPDVFFCWGAGGQTGRYIEQGRVSDLSAFGKKNGWEGRFLVSAEELCKQEGRLYCAPLDLSVVVLWCNKGLFTRHGLRYPTTWGEFESVCSSFKARGVTPLSLGNLDAWPGAFYFCYLANRLGGTDLFKDSAALRNGRDFGDSVFVRAGEMVRTLAEGGNFNVDYAERREDEARKLFVRGRSAMYVGGSWLVGQLVSDASNQSFLEALEPVGFPVVEGGKGDSRVLLGGVNCGFAVSQSSRHQALAMELVDILTDRETAEAWCKIGRIPACKVESSWLSAFPRASRLAYDLLAGSSGLQPYYDQYLDAAVTVEHKNTTRDLLKGRISGAEAAATMKQASMKACK